MDQTASAKWLTLFSGIGGVPMYTIVRFTGTIVPTQVTISKKLGIISPS